MMGFYRGEEQPTLVDRVIDVSSALFLGVAVVANLVAVPRLLASDDSSSHPTPHRETPAPTYLPDDFYHPFPEADEQTVTTT